MRIRAGMQAAVRGLALFLLSQLGSVVLLALAACSIALISIGVGVVTTPAVMAWVRGHANLRRRLAGDWYGVDIKRPYRPPPEPRAGVFGRWDRCEWVLRDPATWRDMVWMLVDASAGAFLAALTVGLFAEGLYGPVLAAGVWRPIAAADGGEWYAFIHVTSQQRAFAAAALGVVLILVGLRYGPSIMAAHARLTRTFLAPSRQQELAWRVAHLAETRSDALDVQAVELRRIERDLHDGAQARLVAMGMSLGAVERLVASDPKRALALLAEVRDSSAKALEELRSLVRGIHPPVLAERGLGDAIRAQALVGPLPTEVRVDIPARPAAPVESAAYFAVSEALANAAKHSGAEHVTVDLRHTGGRLHIQVIDDGHGGADPSRGSGLRGVARRLAAFDGSLTVTSPSGGPTTVTMELPCELSWPKTSSSYEKD